MTKPDNKAIAEGIKRQLAENENNMRSALAGKPLMSGVVKIDIIGTPEARQRYQWNDIGISNLFADTYKNVSCFVPEAKMWYCYDGKAWKPDTGNMKVLQQAKKLTDYMLIYAAGIESPEAKESFIKFTKKCMAKRSRDIMISDAASVYPISITDFDKDIYTFNCQNGTLNLKTLNFAPHNPADYLSKISNVLYTPAAKCERWNKFIDEVMQGDKETAKFLQKALGYSLSGDSSKECFFILNGSTSRNGKGTTIGTTIHLLGDYAKSAQPETVAKKINQNSSAPSEDLARLKGARFVSVSEPENGLRLNVALVKQLTGRDPVTARNLHQSSFDFFPEFKIFINTNHLPKVSDDTIFKSGRVKLIPFERHFEEAERDTNLKTFFENSGNISGIFNWFLEGYKLFCVEGLEPPPEVIKATNEYRESSDIIGSFVKDCLFKCVNNKVKTKAVYDEYCIWCEDNGYRPLNNSNFVGELRKRFEVIRHNEMGNVVKNYELIKNAPDGFC